jgi:hypothetical protein
MCVADDSHIIQGAQDGTLSVYSTLQMSYFVQKLSQKLLIEGQATSGAAIYQIIKLTTPAVV